MRECAIKCWFVIPPLLTNVSALPGETWRWTPEIVYFQSCWIPCLENDTALVCYIFDMHQPILIFFVDNKVVLHLAISFSRHGMQRDWKDTISGVHVSPGSAETLVRRAGITNHRLIAYSLSNISAKKLKLVDQHPSYSVLHQMSFFMRHSVVSTIMLVVL